MNDREKYLFDNTIKYFKELLTIEEQYLILYETIGMEENEMKQYGFDVGVIKKYYEVKTK